MLCGQLKLQVTEHSSAESSLSATCFALDTLGVRAEVFKVRNLAVVKLIILSPVFPLALRRS